LGLKPGFQHHLLTPGLSLGLMMNSLLAPGLSLGLMMINYLWGFSPKTIINGKNDYRNNLFEDFSFKGF
jgi:hypothetical protein